MGLQVAPGYIADPTFQHPAELDRNILEAKWPRTGMVNPGDFLLSVGVGTRAIAVAPGAYVIEGVENSTQGSYFIWSNTADTFLLAAAVGNPRIDSFILRVYDNQYGTIGGVPRAEIEVVQGVAAGSPVARTDSDFNTGGSFYQPGAWARLGDVRVNLADTGSIPAGQITPKYWYATPPGQEIICTVASRPTNQVTGDRIYETDTTFKRRWTGSAWTQDSPWRATQQLGSTAATITFSGIPSTLKFLRATWSLRGTNAGSIVNLRLRLNSNSGSVYNYNRQSQLNGTNSPAVVNDQGLTYFPLGLIPAASPGVTNSMGGGTTEIVGWHMPNNKRPQVLWRSGVYATSSVDAFYEQGQGMYQADGPLTALEFAATTGSLAADSHVELEGWE